MVKLWGFEVPITGWDLSSASHQLHIPGLCLQPGLLPTAVYLPHWERSSRDREEKEAPFFRLLSRRLMFCVHARQRTQNVPINKYQRQYEEQGREPTLESKSQLSTV
ncbi:putative coiled-coil domain-containing protein 26 [Pongo pygmaeus]|uniref:putative coiled-coil domain-containing protein 26 n=1 Tax=Pongo pygmaeus TaxID=9600 RepID=UPI0023E111E9|nr:putative coiled-coil domain-containing protein 26 [Pongo pygmaeus]